MFSLFFRGYGQLVSAVLRWIKAGRSFGILRDRSLKCAAYRRKAFSEFQDDQKPDPGGEAEQQIVGVKRTEME